MHYDHKTLEGNLILSDIFRPSSKTARTIAEVLTGKHDDAIRCAVFLARHQRVATSNAELALPEVAEGLYQITSACRQTFQASIDEADRILRERERQAFQTARHAPSETGTTAEIAARLGISKAEVRKRRAAGML